MKELHANITETVDEAVRTILRATEVAGILQTKSHMVVRYVDGRNSVLRASHYPGEPGGTSAYDRLQLGLEVPELSPETDLVFMTERLSRQLDELTAKMALLGKGQP